MSVPEKRVKVLATIGPSSSSPKVIRALIRKGVNVFRLNFSHGDHAAHLLVIATIRAAAEYLKCEVGILADLQGPKIRTGKTRNNEPVTLRKGEMVRITSKKVVCTREVVSIDYRKLHKDVSGGQELFLNDGAIRLKVTEKRDNGDLMAEVLSGGSFTSHKGVNFPEVKLNIPSLTIKDLRDLTFIISQDIDYVALSFVRTASDVRALRKRLSSRGKTPGVIAKIEKPEAARTIDEILAVADGIMVARGDLGVEMTPYAVPVIQKELIRKANLSGKLVIVATQMLESMIKAPLPTRAEANDVANAIIDGADAIMLSGETAIGAFPVRAVETMSAVAEETEQSVFIRREPVAVPVDARESTHAVCDAAVRAGGDMGNIPLCVFTISGATAFYLSKLHYMGPLYAFSPEIQVVRKLCLAWNVIAFQIPFIPDVLELYDAAEHILLSRRLVPRKTTIGIISGTSAVRGATNLFRIKRSGEH